MLGKKVLVQRPREIEFDRFISQIDTLIRAGKVSESRKAMSRVSFGSIPRNQYATVANLARRVGLISWGLQLLGPLLRSEKVMHPPASVEEKTIYAALLIKAGAVTEALGILKELESLNHAEVLLYSSYAYMERWEYDRVIKYLEKYFKYPNENVYQLTIARVNLAAAYVHEECLDEALDLLSSLRVQCQQEKWTLLLGNCLEISAQIAIRKREWTLADSLLLEAETLSAEAHRYLLFVEKWRAISKLAQNPNSFEVLEEIEKVRAKALSLGAWETLRDLDLHLGISCEDERRLVQLYFGTPYESYRLRIERFFKSRAWTLPKNLLWPTPRSSINPRTFDVSGGTENGQLLVKPGQNLHRLMILLVSDFYRPLSIGYVFSQLYPDEFFNPLTSPSRIFHNVKRIRKIFEERKIPLKVLFKDGRYFLEVTGSYSLLLSKKVSIVKTSKELSHAPIMKKLREEFPFKSFTVTEASKKMNLSRTSLRAILKNALNEKKIYTSGVGRGTLYRFQK